MRRVVIFSALCSLLPAATVSAQQFGYPVQTAVPAPAQNWVQSILPERAFDAGTVARGSKVHHTFTLTNRLNQEVRIADWKTKCGCTEVNVGARVIPPGTQTTIEAVIDTTRFEGVKRSGLTLILDRPQYTEVNLDFSCFIRSDITVTPGFVDFGRVTRTPGAKPSAVTLTLTHHRGQPNWGVTRMQTLTGAVTARLQEQNRSADGQVQYVLTATFDPAGVEGEFKDEITLYTNDGSTRTIPISVVANVQSALTVSPSSLLFGRVKPGQVVKKTLLVRGTGPFKIKGVTSPRDELTSTAAGEEAKQAHTVTLSFTAPKEPGPFNAEVSIETDLAADPIAKVSTFATVEP